MTYQELNLGTPARYRIRVKGTLDASWSDRLGGISITTTGEGDEGSGWTLGVRPGFVREDGPLLLGTTQAKPAYPQASKTAAITAWRGTPGRDSRIRGSA